MALNLERLAVVRDWLASGGDDNGLRFDMHWWFRPKSKNQQEALTEQNKCGSTCCIAGYIAAQVQGNPKTWNGTDPLEPDHDLIPLQQEPAK